MENVPPTRKKPVVKHVRWTSFNACSHARFTALATGTITLPASYRNPACHAQGHARQPQPTPRGRQPTS